MKMKTWVAGLAGLAWTLLPATPAGAGAPPCPKEARTHQVVVAFAKVGGFLSSRKCRIDVHPDRKEVCVGDTVNWVVVNTCSEPGEPEVRDVSIDLLDDVTDPIEGKACSGDVVPAAPVADVARIRCKVKDLQMPAGSSRFEKYSVKYSLKPRGVETVERRVLDPELEIVR